MLSCLQEDAHQTAFVTTYTCCKCVQLHDAAVIRRVSFGLWAHVSGGLWSDTRVRLEPGEQACQPCNRARLAVAQLVPLSCRTCGRLDSTACRHCRDQRHGCPCNAAACHALAYNSLCMHCRQQETTDTNSAPCAGAAHFCLAANLRAHAAV